MDNSWTLKNPDTQETLEIMLDETGQGVYIKSPSHPDLPVQHVMIRKTYREADNLKEYTLSADPTKTVREVFIAPIVRGNQLAMVMEEAARSYAAHEVGEAIVFGGYQTVPLS